MAERPPRQPRDGASRRREPTRVGDLLPQVAARLGIEHELRFARQMTAWLRLVEELVPAASGKTELLGVEPPALLVSATHPTIAQELRLRQAELLEAFARAPDGAHLLELRVSVRLAGPDAGPR